VAQLQDDGFHEIQLNGKQLVFLFMAATVVSVVIFLCGVLVGRGVRAERAGAIDPSASNAVAETIPQQPATPPTPPAGSDPTAAPAPAPAAEDLTYYKRLEKPNAPAEQVRPSAVDKAPAAREKLAAKATPEPTPPPVREPVKPAEKAAAPAEKAAAPAPAPAPPPPAAEHASQEPSGQGYVVQIAALNVRSDADAMVKRLTSKGYAAYVLAPVSGMPSVFRVRVGKFNTRREAESVAARLQKEEQFKPWVTR
jgi:cell division septation protein DedD